MELSGGFREDRMFGVMFPVFFYGEGVFSVHEIEADEVYG